MLVRLVREGRTLADWDKERRGEPVVKVNDLIAIDVHTHAEVSCRQEPDEASKPYDDAASKYFKADKRKTIPETVAYYRERKIGLVMFTVDTEFEMGVRRIPNQEVIDAARENSDMMVAFASIDPHKGKMGVREARRLIEEGGIRGFKFHPTCQGFFPNDRFAYKLYEVIAEAKLPAIFHSGHSGIGTGMPGGGGLKLKYSNPMHVDDVAADFPDMTVIIAHPSWPWQDEALVGVPAQAECLHRSVRLVAEVFFARAGALRQLAAQAQDAVRFGFPADHAGSLDEGLRRGGLQARSAAADPQGKRDQGLEAGVASRSADVHQVGLRGALEFHEQQRDGADQRAATHDDGHGLQRQALLEQVAGENGRQRRAAAPGADDDARAGGTQMRRIGQREQGVQADDAGIREERRRRRRWP